MPVLARKRLKEKFHKKLCDVRMQIIGPSAAYQKPIYNILAMNLRVSDDDQFEPLDVDELAEAYD